MFQWRVSFILAIAAIWPIPAYADDGPASEVPELTVLNHYLGKWEVNYESEKAAFSGGTSTAEWDLDGRFLRQTLELNAQFTQPKTLRIMRLVTFDQDSGLYRSWTFIANGRVLEASGKWNADTDTMTWTSRDNDNGTIHKSTEVFHDVGTQKWTKVSINAAGETTGQSHGTTTRTADD